MTESELHTAFLLGELPEADQERLEEEAFERDEVHEALSVCETELFDAYLDGTLSRDRRERFSERFLASREGQERLAFAAALRDSARSHAPVEDVVHFEKRPWLGRHPKLVLGTLSTAIAAAACLLLLLRDPGPKSQTPLAVHLEEVATRSQAPVARVPPKTPLEVTLSVSAAFAGHDAFEVWLLGPAKTRLLQSSGPLPLRVAIAELSPGDYELEVRARASGSESFAAIAYYRLRVRP